jgi:hypothetical protein
MSIRVALSAHENEDAFKQEKGRYYLCNTKRGCIQTGEKSVLSSVTRSEDGFKQEKSQYYLPQHEARMHSNRRKASTIFCNMKRGCIQTGEKSVLSSVTRSEDAFKQEKGHSLL